MFLIVPLRAISRIYRVVQYVSARTWDLGAERICGYVHSYYCVYTVMKMDLNLLSHESQPLSINIAIFLHSTNLNKNSKNRAFFFHGAVWKGFVWVASFWSLVVSQTQNEFKEISCSSLFPLG